MARPRPWIVVHIVLVAVVIGTVLWAVIAADARLPTMGVAMVCAAGVVVGLWRRSVPAIAGWAFGAILVLPTLPLVAEIP
jgi:hypothetical protein